jgi:GNAT superfamily N-acetyltransferase
MGNVNEINIRDYKPEDFKGIIEIAESLPEWFTKNGLENMKKDLGFQPGFVAEKDSDRIGFLSYFVSEGVGQIGWMGVLKELHRNGIGRKLVERTSSALKSAGISRLRVYTLGDSVEYEPYARTRAFYWAVGFEDHERIKQDNPECPEQLIMIKKM